MHRKTGAFHADNVYWPDFRPRVRLTPQRSVSCLLLAYPARKRANRGQRIGLPVALAKAEA